MNSGMLEARRSSRPHKVAKVASYSDEADIELPPLRKRAKANSSKSYTERKPHEIKVATIEKRANAMERAEKLRSGLQSGRPSFIKSMIKSHVYTCYWLGIPSLFCKDHLPSKEQKMILENEKGEEYETNLIGSRSGLSGGWRGFALNHKLHDGDAVVFELTEPARFKVYIVRADDDPEEENDAVVIQAVDEQKMEQEVDESEKAVELADTINESEKSVELANSIHEEAAPKPQLDGSTKRSRRKPTKPMKSDDGVSNSQKFDSVKGVEEEDDIDDVILNGAAEATNQGDMAVASKTQKEDAPKKFRKRSETTAKLFRKRRTWA